MFFVHETEEAVQFINEHAQNRFYQYIRIRAIQQLVEVTKSDVCVT